MGNIVVLDDLTINKIAAGEVIERPASVIKEMVENSIDAGATSISVEIKNGGISYIRITDNGKGIEKDDMELAFERHATSKIRQADDLENVKSMGFRGEALASIAAVANVEMISRTLDSDIGNRIVVEAGNILEEEETGSPIGTTITVRNLFFNTPVRYKFLKRDYTESGYIEDAVTRLALINPSISFKLINSGKTILQTSGDGNMKNVVYSIYGKDIAEGIVDVNYTYEDIHVSGVVGKPEIARSNRSHQTFFVNRRYIRNKTLSGSAEQSFKGLLPIGKYGFLILNVDVPSNKVDVNVHPAKLEVRFEEDSKIFKAVYHAIKDSLLKGELIENTEKENTEDDIKENLMHNEETSKDQNKFGISSLFNKMRNTEEIKDTVEKELDSNTNLIADVYTTRKEAEEKEERKLKTPTEEQVDGITKLIQMQKALQDEVDNMKNGIENKNIDNDQNIEIQSTDNQGQTSKIDIKEALDKIENPNIIENAKDFDEMYVKMFGKMPPSKEEKERENFAAESANEIIKGDNISVFEELEEYKTMPNYKFVGIAFSTYIIIEMDKDMYIIDQHAAHERIMYEKVKKNFYSEGEKESQMLLLPDVITLTHKEMDIAKENLKLFEKAGFTLEEFGDNTIKLTGVPDICIDLDTKELFLETLDEINTVARTAKQEIEEKFIATVACKSAVKANMNLSKEEVDSLMKKLLVLPNPFTCPHGRPTAIKMTKTDLEKKFSRR